MKFFQDEKAEEPRPEDASARTPTKDTFGGLSGQRPLPDEPATPSTDPGKLSRHGFARQSSHRSTNSVDSHDMGMDEDDEDVNGSDNESVTSDSQRPSKKKKGQRFFCTEFPPCQLSFTRSEHLARHIR
ncbi:hypothetical protein LTS18_000599, partial [Coniosporium uncinatum]